MTTDTASKATTKHVHRSATCVVYEALDEDCLDDEGNPIQVALKFMMIKEQFLREANCRINHTFDSDYVIDIIRCHPEVASSDIDSYPDRIQLTDQRRLELEALTKEHAEQMFLVVMPLAERNLHVILKLERFAGQDFDTIKHVMTSLIYSVQHMHSKGILHADLKPVNVMRMVGKWKLIDLDAVGRIGEDPVCLKSSSAYIPPEAVYVSVNADRTIAVVRSPESHILYGDYCAPLIAHESFDVWSLGCIFYQLVNEDVSPFWRCDRDDNLSADASESDSLFELFNFSDGLKAKKLQHIRHPLARNLISQMLSKDPSKRPSFLRILQHPFFFWEKGCEVAGGVA